MGLAVLCAGQGGQHPAMFEPFEHGDGEAIDRLSAAAGFDLAAVARAGLPKIHANAIAQPTIVAYQGLVWTRVAPRLAAAGLAVDCVAGYSIGELASHACAGRLVWTEAVGLARERARLMDEAAKPGGGLIAIGGLPRAALEALPSTAGLHVAIVNGLDRFVLGGPVAAFEALVAGVVDRGGTARALPVGLAAHTPWLSDAVAPFRLALEGAAWRPATVPVLSGLDGSIVRDRSTAIDVLSRQVATTIRWSDCMDALRERGVRRCLELGPGNALARMMVERHRDVDARSVADFRSVDAAVAWAARAA